MADKLCRFQISMPQRAGLALANLSSGNGMSASQVAVKKICDHFGVPYEMKVVPRLRPSEKLTQEQIEARRAKSRRSDAKNGKKSRNNLRRLKNQTGLAIKLRVDIGERPESVLTQLDPTGKRSLLTAHPAEWDDLPPEERRRRINLSKTVLYQQRLKETFEAKESAVVEKALAVEDKAMRTGFRIIGMGSDRCCLECRFYGEHLCRRWDLQTELGGTCDSFEPLLGD